MIDGTISGDARRRVSWEAAGHKTGLLNRIVGTGRLTAPKYSLTKFKIASKYCDSCKKMIFDTNIIS